MQIKDMILVSDLDGTIVYNMGNVSKKNIDAINKFRSLGGTFTVATGRSPIQAKPYLDEMNIECPIIANNGAVIYHPKNNENLWVKNFNPSYKEVIIDVKAKFPQIGIVAISGIDTYTVLVNNCVVEEYERISNAGYSVSNNGTPPDECCKVLFAIKKQDISEVSTYLINKGYNDVEFVLSGQTCLEMMPKGISKGYPFERFINIHGKKIENSVAIGDYNNDVEMIQKAGFGVAVGNALDNVKSVADMVVKNCEEDGLCELIKHLINNTNNGIDN